MTPRQASKDQRRLKEKTEKEVIYFIFYKDQLINKKFSLNTS